MLKTHFSTFLHANRGYLHAAAHSHHPWPDVALAAHQQYALDSAIRADRKWEYVFDSVLPEARQHIARGLGGVEGSRIAFAPNTGEFVARIYSCFDEPERRGRPTRVLTTASEFHSFARMTRRLEEAGRVVVTRVSTQPYDTFASRFAEALSASQPYDLAFISEVFFDSGFHADVGIALANAPAATQLVVDGYHAFMALPVNFAALANRAFYMSGGYKYAMAGEGACWLYVPPAADHLRPTNTGWFADFGALAGPQDRVTYGPGGYRFFGSTFDASGLYRHNAVQRWLNAEGAMPASIHAHSIAMQQVFLEGLGERKLDAALARFCMLSDATPRGNFLAFALASVADAEAMEAAIKAEGVYIDRRENRLRFGFGVYHDAADVDNLLARLAGVV